MKITICGDFEKIIIIELLKKRVLGEDSENYLRGYLVFYVVCRVPATFNDPGCRFLFFYFNAVLVTGWPWNSLWLTIEGWACCWETACSHLHLTGTGSYL